MIGIFLCDKCWQMEAGHLLMEPYNSEVFHAQIS